jgi:hypothetical protein
MRIMAKRENFGRFKNSLAFNSLPNRDSTKKAGKRSPYGAYFGNPGNVGIMGRPVIPGLSGSMAGGG